jgi:hypothetical protein
MSVSADIPLDRLPGFRRRFRITPAPGSVRAEVEDDFHCMSVTVHHDGVTATRIEPVMARAPWTTCPGAVEQAQRTFAGVALAAFPARGDKSANCTHLYDLALLAAAHAFDRVPLIYDLLVSDPVDGERRAELRRDGRPVLAWTERRFQITEPAELAGLRLDQLRSWIDSLDPAGQEAARLLRWGNMLANGRTISLEQQSDATLMPPNCYTFQPQRRTEAKRVGVIRDFSRGSAQPLEEPEAVPQ